MQRHWTAGPLSLTPLAEQAAVEVEAAGGRGSGPWHDRYAQPVFDRDAMRDGAAVVDGACQCASRP